MDGKIYGIFLYYSIFMENKLGLLIDSSRLMNDPAKVG